MENTELKKRQSHAFGKDVYFLGTIDDKYQWLEAPSWDCNWYWGFGYVEEYTSHKSPQFSKDIVSHTHIDSLLKNKSSLQDVFKNTPLSDRELWDLTELFRQFYLLKDMAAFSGKDKPGCHVTSSPVDHGNLKEWSDMINKEMIPKITAKIIEILKP